VFVIGLTGGMASGKSTVASFLADRVAKIIDADEISKEIVAPESEPYRRLIASFGQEILAADGTIDRGRLGKIVFGDERKLKFLNQITHPPIIKRIHDELRSLRDFLKPEDMVVLRAPLLIEAGLTDQVDFVVVVVAGEDVRIKRIEAQRGLTADEAKQRLMAQLPDSEKVRFADYVIENNGSLDELKAKSEKLWQEIQLKVRGNRG
jgi:dephospho-CoA kinase